MRKSTPIIRVSVAAMLVLAVILSVSCTNEPPPQELLKSGYAKLTAGQSRLEQGTVLLKEGQLLGDRANATIGALETTPRNPTLAEGLPDTVEAALAELQKGNEMVRLGHETIREGRLLMEEANAEILRAQELIMAIGIFDETTPRN